MAVTRTLPLPIALCALALLLTACGTDSEGHRRMLPMPAPGTPAAKHGDIGQDLPRMPRAGSGRGGYYQDDGPGDNPPPNLNDVPDAIVKDEPYARYANRPYVVFGKTYTPLLNEQAFKQRGVGSWYGKKFHGQRTSSGELYDMYKMTAAHPTLPIPSYARITSLDSGKQVVVRINDRGPFHSSRVVDVSYTAALKLGLLGKGSHMVEVERLLPNAQERIATIRRLTPEPDGEVSTMAVDMPPPGESSAMLVTARAAVLAPAANAPSAAGAAPAATPGFYLQLGAFARADKAADVRAQIAATGGALSSVEVVQGGALHRLFSGPFPSRADAMQALRELPATLRLKPIVVQR
ncbi:septal ring lytic transglycosylase RlpA family protein [Massilia antarctica]|uniref:septal ring lytic transglycosylase RlpA family protein n=1 Tax=Massilia antarctica TaxID=2765360 RepID=UPI00226DA9DA|nr:septal ring lytic transglycosylase RlpA family protein [Massilia sp. H27-R4]MCY0915904.1 septal ring lytic transglycosylase RlpA family protein [Massilia sp. H27-R4]